MKITIEHYNAKYSTEIENDDVALPEALQLLSGLLKSAGFSFSGELQVVEEDHSIDDD